MTRRKRDGDRVSSTASSNNEGRARAVSMIPRNGPVFFSRPRASSCRMEFPLANRWRVTHVLAIAFEERGGDIIGDSFVPLLRSRFCLRPFLCLPPRSCYLCRRCCSRCTFLLLVLPRTFNTKVVGTYSLANGVMRDYYLICIAVKLPGLGVNVTTTTYAVTAPLCARRNLFRVTALPRCSRRRRRSRYSRRHARRERIARARRENVILTCP